MGPAFLPLANALLEMTFFGVLRGGGQWLFLYFRDTQEMSPY